MSLTTVLGGGSWTCEKCGRMIIGTSIHHDCPSSNYRIPGFFKTKEELNNNTMKEYFEKNPESKIYLDRLVNEWKQYGKIIVATDFDSTISPYHTLDNHADINRVINVLKLVKEIGAYVIIFTACNADRFDYIKDYCVTIGLEIDSINQTPIDIPYGKNGKVYANIFIDDRAGLNEALAILEFASYIMRGSKNGGYNFDI